MLKFVLYATQKAETRNEAFKETITEVKMLWDMARVKTIEARVCKKKNRLRKKRDICRIAGHVWLEKPGEV